MAKTTKKQSTRKPMTNTESPKTVDVLQEDAAVAATAPNGTVGGDGDQAPKPDGDEIARLAYSYWEGRGGQGGSPEEDWFRAQQELRAPK